MSAERKRGGEDPYGPVQFHQLTPKQLFHKSSRLFKQHDVNVLHLEADEMRTMTETRLRTNAAYRSSVQTQTFTLNTVTSCSTPVRAAAMCWLTEQRWCWSDCSTTDIVLLIKNNELWGLNLLQPSDLLRSPLCSSDRHFLYLHITRERLHYVKLRKCIWFYRAAP